MPAETPEPWYASLFIAGAVQHYSIPSVLTDVTRAEPGFRAALGCEWRRFLFSVESGYTHIIGTNPLVLDIGYTPLMFKAGYMLPLKWGAGIEADLGIGLLYSKVERYETAIDAAMNNKTDDSGVRSLLAGARLYGTYTLPGSFLKVYAGGGADFILENESPIPLPVLEAGISLKPFRLAGRLMRRKPPPAPPEPNEHPAVQEPAAIRGRTAPEEIVPEVSTPDRNAPLPAEPAPAVSTPDRNTPLPAEPAFFAVYFEANNAVLIERFRPELDRCGELLRGEPSLTVTLHAYSGPFHTREGQMTVAAKRAAFCREYLAHEYGIDEERIRIELHGAERPPAGARGKTWESYRCVELIIQGGQ